MTSSTRQLAEVAPKKRDQWFGAARRRSCSISAVTRRTARLRSPRTASGRGPELVWPPVGSAAGTRDLAAEQEGLAGVLHRLQGDDVAAEHQGGYPDGEDAEFAFPGRDSQYVIAAVHQPGGEALDHYGAGLEDASAEAQGG